MLKKIAIGTVLIVGLPFLSKSFRQGFKEGWNEEGEKQRAAGVPGAELYPMFKNV